jgi:hypothetical protein
MYRWLKIWGGIGSSLPGKQPVASSRYGTMLIA